MKHLIIFFFVVTLELIQGHVLPGNNNPEITIPSGKVEGQLVNIRGSQVYQFLGIPYAEPPLNELRFKKPVPVKPWEGVLSHSSWTPHCIQSPFPAINGGYQFSEDCLNVNVFTPASAVSDTGKLRPVMVWIHGGGFSYGSANYEIFNGTIYAALENVVYVSVNYRVGPLGFLSSPEHNLTGNYGFWDQRLALQWVQDNIRYFGGDPDEVTIFGQSAGSISVSAHVLSPQSRGLFKNAIIQSGTMYNNDHWFEENSFDKVLNSTGCKSSHDVTSCLQSVDAEAFRSLNGFICWPVFGDEFLPGNSTQLMEKIDPNVNILLGTSGNEGVSILMIFDPVTFDYFSSTSFTLDQAKDYVRKLYGESAVDYVQRKYLNQVDPNNSNELRSAVALSFGDDLLACPTYMFGADAMKHSKANLYAYYFSQSPSDITNPYRSRIPTSHGDEIQLSFGIPIRSASQSSDDVILSLKMLDIWANFAKNNETLPLGSKEWAKWKLDESGNVDMFVMELNSNKLGQVNNERAINCVKDWPSPIQKIFFSFTI